MGAFPLYDQAQQATPTLEESFIRHEHHAGQCNAAGASQRLFVMGENARS
jgi:hypothetical protein